MSIYDKLKWILGITLVFVVILTTNLIDKENFSSLKNAIVSIYEDRVIASDLIFQFSEKVHAKELAHVQQDTSFFNTKNKRINTQIKELITAYHNTKLTREEQQVFQRFLDDLTLLKDLEAKGAPYFKGKGEYRNILHNLNRDLLKLSKIQLKESRRQMFMSQKNINSVELFTQLEIIFLVLLAILIQIIVLYNPNKKK